MFKLENISPVDHIWTIENQVKKKLNAESIKFSGLTLLFEGKIMKTWSYVRSYDVKENSTLILIIEKSAYPPYIRKRYRRPLSSRTPPSLSSLYSPSLSSSSSS